MLTLNCRVDLDEGVVDYVDAPTLKQRREEMCYKNFKKLKSDLDLSVIREELATTPFWVDMSMRASVKKTQVNTHRIQLRTNAQVPGKTYFDIHQTVDLDAWHALISVRKFVETFVAEVGGAVGHVRVANLLPGSDITPHIDIGEYCAVRDRYHLVINSDQGTEFVVEDETVVMLENELWWFDNKKMHSVRNLGEKPRTHLVFDVLPQPMLHFIEK
ncbi:hypothetical protein C0V76_10980 [Uliginosibacterium sp. TH139]|nr:hypothetical protein C0V76_10980 [Uliginosibacterium sp. TH139]